MGRTPPNGGRWPSVLRSLSNRPLHLSLGILLPKRTFKLAAANNRSDSMILNTAVRSRTEPRASNWHHPDRVVREIILHDTTGMAGHSYESDMPGFASILAKAEVEAIFGCLKSE